MQRNSDSCYVCPSFCFLFSNVLCSHIQSQSVIKVPGKTQLKHQICCDNEWMKLCNGLWLVGYQCELCVCAFAVCRLSWCVLLCCLFHGPLWYFELYFSVLPPNTECKTTEYIPQLPYILTETELIMPLHRQIPPSSFWQLSSGEKNDMPLANVMRKFQQSKCQGGPLALCGFVCTMLKSCSVACVVQQWAWAVQNLVGNAGEKVPLQHIECTMNEE